MYDIELNKLKKAIKENNAKKILLQFPDGLKPKSKEIVDEINKDNDLDIFLWAGSCFGACDYPSNIENLGFDLMIAWGHSEWQ